MIASRINATMGADAVAAVFASDKMLMPFAGAVASYGMTGEFLVSVKNVAADLEVVCTSLGLTPIARLALLQKLSLAAPPKGRVAARKATTMQGHSHSFDPHAAAKTLQATFEHQRSEHLLKIAEEAQHLPVLPKMRELKPAVVLDEVGFLKKFQPAPTNSVKIKKGASGFTLFEKKKGLHQKTFGIKLSSDSTYLILEFTAKGRETLRDYINAGRTKKNSKMLDSIKAKKMLDTAFNLTPQIVTEAFKVFSDELTTIEARLDNEAFEITARLSCDEIDKEKDQLLAKVRGEATAKKEEIMATAMRTILGVLDMPVAAQMLARGSALVEAARVDAEKTIKKIEEKYGRAAAISASTDAGHRPVKKAKSGPGSLNAWNSLQQATPGWTPKERHDYYMPAQAAKRANQVKATAAAAAQDLAAAHGLVVPPGPPRRLPTSAPPTDPAPSTDLSDLLL